MSKMISARVPDAVFEQASLVLKALGVGTSDLVNAAFEYVLSERKLPETKSSSSANTRRKLPAAEQKRLSDVFRKCTLNIDIPNDVAYDKQVMHHARAAKGGRK